MYNPFSGLSEKWPTKFGWSFGPNSSFPVQFIVFSLNQFGKRRRKTCHSTCSSCFSLATYIAFASRIAFSELACKQHDNSQELLPRARHTALSYMRVAEGYFPNIFRNIGFLVWIVECLPQNQSVVGSSLEAAWNANTEVIVVNLLEGVLTHNF